MGLILVGVVHRDPDGHERLYALLESLGPDAVTVELSPMGLLWRELNGPRLLRALESMAEGLPPGRDDYGQLELVREGLRLPFEFTASLAYCSSHGVPLHLMDLNWTSRRHLPMYESELLTRHNVTLLAELRPDPARELVKKAYLRAAWCLAREKSPWMSETAMWEEVTGRVRERLLACRVRRLVRRHGTVAHVGGWVHLVYDEQGLSLASLLSDLHPCRILLEGGGGPLSLYR